MAEIAQPNIAVYDLGCSTGITLGNIRHGIAGIGKPVKLGRREHSQPMLNRVKARFVSSQA